MSQKHTLDNLSREELITMVLTMQEGLFPYTSGDGSKLKKTAKIWELK